MARKLWRLFVRDIKLIAPTLLIICLAYIAVAGALFYSLGDRQDKYGGLVGNIFAGSIDTLIAVILINFFIAKSELKRKQSLRFAAYLRLEGGLRIFLLTWSDMFIASSETMPPPSTDLFTAESIQHISQHLDLDALSGLANNSWFARASAGALAIRDTLKDVTSRFSFALEPDEIVEGVDFEKCILIGALADLRSASIPFSDKGITMGKPFMLEYAVKDLPILVDFRSMLERMAEEFEMEPEFRALPSFKMHPTWIEARSAFLE